MPVSSQRTISSSSSPTDQILVDEIAAGISSPLELWARRDVWQLEGRFDEDQGWDADPTLGPLDAFRESWFEGLLADPGRVVRRDCGPAAWIGMGLETSTDHRVVCASVPVAKATLAESFVTQVCQRHATERQLAHLQAQVKDLRAENDSLAIQITEDFEELNLLRTMADHLEIGSIHQDTAALARVMLPLVKPALHALGIGLVMCAEGPMAIPGQLAPRLWLGPPVLNDFQCVSLVRQFAEQANCSPVVINHCQQTELTAMYPELKNLMVVAMNASGRLIGYLVAVNHVTTCNEVMRNARWERDQTEFGTSEASLLSTIGAIMAAHSTNVQLLREKEDLLTSMVRALVGAIEAKDKYTRGHSERVALYGRALAAAAGYSEVGCERIYLTGLLHDVGKIGVNDAVLTKPSRLTDEEFEEIKKHPDEGWSILCDLDQLSYVMPGLLYHHERFDGKGYPDGLEGDDIPMDGRILAVVDAYDAMTSDRPYRAGMPQEKAEAILRDGSGTQWDPELIEHFFSIMREIEWIRESFLPRNRRTRMEDRGMA